MAHIETDLDQPAFQDRIPANQCWGCGPQNDHGLHVKSRWAGDESVCTWQPAWYHMAGPPTVLNGGIIATIIDCHCVCTAIAAAYRAEGRAVGVEPRIWYATASLHVTYLQPTAINAPVTLRARIEQVTDRKTILTCSLLSEGEERATGEVTAVRVRAGWGEEE